MVNQVKQSYAYYDLRISYHKTSLWDMMDKFEDFNIKCIPRRENVIDFDFIKIIIRNLESHKSPKLNRFLVEFVPIPSTPKNIKNLQVFEYDKHIFEFMSNKNIFDVKIIDKDTSIDVKLEEDEVINLKSNNFTKSMVTL